MQVSSRLAGRTTPRSLPPTRLQLPSSSQENHVGAAAASPRPGIAHEAVAGPTQRLQLSGGSQGSKAETATRLSNAPEAVNTASQRPGQYKVAHCIGSAARSEVNMPLATHVEMPQQDRSAEGSDRRQDSRERDQPRMVLGLQTPTARPHGLSSTGDTLE